MLLMMRGIDGMDQDQTWIKSYSSVTARTRAKFEFQPSWRYTGSLYRGGGGGLRPCGQVTSSIVHAVWQGEESCELNELPGGPPYSLTKLENEFQNIVHLGWFQYYIKKFCEPALQGLRFSGVGGFITSCQWTFWLLCMLKRTLVACCKPPMSVQNEIKLRSEVLLELMGG